MTNPENPRDDRPRTIAELVAANEKIEQRVRGLGKEAGPDARYSCVSTAEGVTITIFVPLADLFEMEPEAPSDDSPLDHHPV